MLAHSNCCPEVCGDKRADLNERIPLPVYKHAGYKATENLSSNISLERSIISPSDLVSVGALFADLIALTGGSPLKRR